MKTKLSEKIEREIGPIAAGPTEINRGYWAYNSDVFRWCVVINEDGHQRYYGCRTAMATALKGKLTRRKSNRGHGEWEIIVEPNEVFCVWQYSRNQLRHEVCDGEVYKYGRDFYQLFEIRSNRNPCQIRQATDTHRLLHKGKQVAESKSIKSLKETAAKLHEL